MTYFSKADPNGYLYCIRLDKVESGAFVPCETCEYFRGTIQGEGRQCEVGQDDQVVYVDDPYDYMSSKHLPDESGEG